MNLRPAYHVAIQSIGYGLLAHASGLTQSELGKRLGVSPAAISQFEKTNANLTTETVKKIADALSVQVADLIYIPSEEPEEISPDHPIAFPGLEKKLSEIGYHIGYGCDYAEYSDNDIWIEYPEGKKLFISLTELENLNLETDIYLKFRIEQLSGKKK